MALFGSSAPAAAPAVSDPESQKLKASILQQMQQEVAVSNAKKLIGKINQNCFDNCITTPGSSMSSSDSTCLSNCMEKYIQFWNVTSQAYMSRATTEQVAANAMATENV
ncbi:mitochondrial import inner membrane translocase subunit tim13 [Aspergillus multicolor]|uniref:protein translocase subunit TIM13 n=1 Tax=Aspergillus multicolor TaxID=41759 RepID=UPI003CCE05F1